MNKKEYSFIKVGTDPVDISADNFWQDIQAIKIRDYRWSQNNYKPEVLIKGCYTGKYIYIYFLVFEEKITARYMNVNDPVFKDSCVEFFLNLFPAEKEEYFNIEINAIGTIKMGYGIKRNRIYLGREELAEMKVIPTIKEPVTGKHGSDHWKIFCAIPLDLLEKHSHKKFEGEDAIGNFYKCGDETEFKHYGMWNLIDNPAPDFHLPEFFGNIKFV